VLEPLSERFRVIAVDLPGFGETDCPLRRYDTAAYAEFLRGVVDMAGVPGVVLCGISWGGEIALRFADSNPERVERLILLCCTGFRQRPLAATRLFRIVVSALMNGTVFRSKAIVDFMSRRSYYDVERRPSDLCDQFIGDLARPGRKTAFANAFLAALRGDPEFTRRLSRLRMPLLVVWGRNDAIVPMKDALRFRRQIPESALELISECGHSIPLEKPRELVHALTMFNT
jgi:pimeloyl-ACP methyl ester carboxylesterase